MAVVYQSSPIKGRFRTANWPILLSAQLCRIVTLTPLFYQSSGRSQEFAAGRMPNFLSFFCGTGG